MADQQEQTAAERLETMMACKHRKRSGGNDYLECSDCGLMWDYRRESPALAVTREARALLQPPPPEVEKVIEVSSRVARWLRTFSEPLQATSAEEELVTWAHQMAGELEAALRALSGAGRQEE